MAGWIKLHRSIQEHWIWDNPTYLKWWLDLLLMANHKPNEVLVNGKIETIDIGERLTSEVKLSERWNVDRKTVRKFLNLLEKERMISVTKSRQKGTTYKVLKYKDYQQHFDSDRDIKKDNGVPNGMDNDMDNGMDINKNEKNEKNEKNINNNKEGVYPAELIQSLYGKLPTGVLQASISEWLQSWPREMISFAIQTSFDYGKELNALKPYINRILENWSKTGIDTIEKAVEANNQFKQRQAKPTKQPSGFRKQSIRKEPLPDWVDNPTEEIEDPEQQAAVNQRLQAYLKKQQAEREARENDENGIID